MKKGFTLVELILYVAIFTLMMTSLIPFAWNIIGGGAKSTTQQEISSNARYVSEIIKYEIRRASGITSVTSTSISLTNFSPDSTTVIGLSGGKITISKNGGGAVNLNSNDTTISSLTFTNYTSAGNTSENIQFAFTMNSNFNQTRKEYQSTLSVEGDAEVRSN
jgi:type II secretory pathway pseudopilin PulG